MRKNILSLSIAAMCGGLGRVDSSVALVPYYTAPSHSEPPLSITYPEKQGKAVKVRFRGASSRDDVYDFNLFLAPGDVWKGPKHVPPR